MRTQSWRNYVVLICIWTGNKGRLKVCFSFVYLYGKLFVFLVLLILQSALYHKPNYHITHIFIEGFLVLQSDMSNSSYFVVGTKKALFKLTENIKYTICWALSWYPSMLIQWWEEECETLRNNWFLALNCHKIWSCLHLNCNRIFHVLTECTCLTFMVQQKNVNETLVKSLLAEKTSMKSSEKLWIKPG